VIFVRPDRRTTFDVLVERCALLDDVDVRWDRRSGGERRGNPDVVARKERRLENRRQVTVHDADLRGYTVVDLPDTSGLALAD